MKRILPPLALVLALLLGGCSTTQQQVNTYNATLYVQGYLDETYTGRASDAYLTLMDADADDLEAAFEKNLQAEYAQRLAVRFQLDDRYVPDALRASYLDLLRSVYAKVHYTVRAAVPLDDKRYAVEVSVSPVTFFSAAYADGFAALRTRFQSTHKQLTDEERERLTAAQIRDRTQRYESAWAKEVYDYLYGRLDAVTNGSPVTKLLLVSPNASGLYAISQTDLQDLDDVILKY